MTIPPNMSTMRIVNQRTKKTLVEIHGEFKDATVEILQENLIIKMSPASAHIDKNSLKKPRKGASAKQLRTTDSVSTPRGV